MLRGLELVGVAVLVVTNAALLSQVVHLTRVVNSADRHDHARLVVGGQATYWPTGCGVNGTYLKSTDGECGVEWQKVTEYDYEVVDEWTPGTPGVDPDTDWDGASGDLVNSHVIGAAGTMSRTSPHTATVGDYYRLQIVVGTVNTGARLDIDMGGERIYSNVGVDNGVSGNAIPMRLGPSRWRRVTEPTLNLTLTGTRTIVFRYEIHRRVALA